MINKSILLKHLKFSSSGFTPTPEPELLKPGIGSADSRLVWGFTLIEVLAVFSITTFIMVSLLTSLTRAKASLTEASQVLIADIRMMQANALASKQFVNPVTGVSSYRCGYGLTRFSNPASYYLYAGRLNNTGLCPGAKIYNNQNSTPIFFGRTLDSRLELVINAQFRNIYFESPDGNVFINNNNCPVGVGASKSQIIIRRKGAVCPSTNCRYVCVYAFGKIESRDSPCPDIAC